MEERKGERRKAGDEDVERPGSEQVTRFTTGKLSSWRDGQAQSRSHGSVSGKTLARMTLTRASSRLELALSACACL